MVRRHGRRSAGHRITLLVLGVALLWLAACAPGPFPSPPVTSPAAATPTAPPQAPESSSPLATPIREPSAPEPLPPTPEGAFQSPLPAPLAATPPAEVPKIRAVETPSPVEGGVRLIPPSKGAPFRTLAQGRSTASVARPLLLVTDSREGLAAIQELLPDLVVSQTGEAVNLSREVVVAALYGGPAGGAPVTIEDIRTQGRDVILLARIPGAGAKGPAVVEPSGAGRVGYHLAALPKDILPRWDAQPLRYTLRAVDDGVLARTIPLGPKDRYLGFDVLVTGMAEGPGPSRTLLFVAASEEDLAPFLSYIEDRGHRQALRGVDWAQDVVVAVFQGRRAGQAAGVHIGTVRRATNWVILHATFPQARGLMLPEVGPYAYQVVRLHRADLQGWGVRPYQFFLVGKRLQQLATAEYYPADVQPLPMPGKGGADQVHEE